MTDDVCGSTNTYTSEPCQNPAGSCPVDAHDEVSPDGGRPSKFTEDRKERILEAAENGTTKEGCARAGGVTYRTLKNWLDKGEEATDENDDYFQFFQDFTRARSEAEQRLIRSEDVPATFLLERSYSGYTKTEKREHEHTGEGGGPLEVVIRRERHDG